MTSTQRVSLVELLDLSKRSDTAIYTVTRRSRR